MRAHKPGPWHIADDGFCYEADAFENQHLVAAAPDLLAALERLHDDTADYVRINNLGDPYQNQNMRDARAAIAKARGQA